MSDTTDPEQPPRRKSYKEICAPKTRLQLSRIKQKSLELSDLMQVQRIQSKKQSHAQLERQVDAKRLSCARSLSLD